MKIDPNTAQDLRDAYLLTFDSFAVVPTDLVDHTAEGRNWNTRYARELLGTLVSAGLVTVAEGGDGEDVWQTFPDTYDNMTREEAESRIDSWLNNNTEENAMAKSATANKKSKPAEQYHECYCGCGSNVPTKSFYRPGHDARHAGQVGRQLAILEPGSTGYSDLLNELPSDRLQEKAKGIEAKARDKADAKAQREQAKQAKREQATVDPGDDGTALVEQGIVKVGKKEYVAIRHTATGVVKYFVGDETKTASKTASKTFTAG